MTDYTIILPLGATLDLQRRNAPPQVAQTITSFTATPSTIPQGGTVTLNWATANATAVLLDGAPVSATGSVTRTPNANAVYTLVAKGSAPDATRTASVAVTTAPPVGGPLDTILPGTARQIGIYPFGVRDGEYGARLAYSSMALDPATGRLVQQGGEHDGLGPNDNIEFDPVTMKWTAISPCTPKAMRTIENVGVAYTALTPVVTGWVFPDGQPAIGHTYNTPVIIGSKFILASNGGALRVCWWDRATNKWGYSNHKHPWHYDCGACATTDGKVLVVSSTRAWIYDPATDTEVALPTLNAMSVKLSVVYYPPNGKYYVISGLEPGATKIKVVEITLGPSPSVVEVVTTGPAPSYDGYIAMDYDPVNKTIGGLIGQASNPGPPDIPSAVPGEYFAFKPETREWRKWIVTDANGVKPAVWFFGGKFLKSGIYIGMSGWTQTPSMMTWALRPPAWV